MFVCKVSIFFGHFVWSLRLLTFYQIVPASEIISNIPKKFSTNETGIKTAIDILENPIIAKPSSSGRGEIMTSAPMNGTSHLNILSLKIDRNLWKRDFLTRSVTSSTNEFFRNENRIRSPIIAPIAPNKATVSVGVACEIFTRATDAGAILKREVKNMPATKLPKNLTSWAVVINLSKALVFRRIIATAILTSTSSMSRMIFDRVCLFVLTG